MQTEIIESSDDLKDSNVQESTDLKVAETPETQKVEETPAVEAEETPKEAPEESIDFKGQKIPVSKIDQLLKDYENDSKWKARNQAESEAVKKQRSELAQLEFLKAQIEQRPDVIQALLTPQKVRDFDAEYREIFSKRPDPLDSENYSRWEMAKDQILYEKATNDVMSKTTAEASRRMALEQANALERKGYEEFVGKGKVSPDEFREMTEFITKNVKPVNDRYPENSFDIAYKILHEDKWVESIRQEAAKKSIAPLLKATVRNAEAGIHKPQVQTTEEDDANDDFVKAVRANHKGKWIPIPQ